MYKNTHKWHMEVTYKSGNSPCCAEILHDTKIVRVARITELNVALRWKMFRREVDVSQMMHEIVA